MNDVRLGLRENLAQFSLLVIVNAFVGASQRPNPREPRRGSHSLLQYCSSCFRFGP